MKLTGNSLEQFEKWYQECYDKENLPYIQGFYASSFSIQYGVLVDFFDSVRICIDSGRWVCSGIDKNVYYYFNLKDESDKSLIDDYNEIHMTYSKFKSRTQARTKAIEKANEILNSRV